MNHVMEVFARLHVLLVHLPVGFILLLGGLELVALVRRRKTGLACAGTILALTFPALVLTALSGWLLAAPGGYDAQVLWWHRWTGLAVGALELVIWFFWWRRWESLYRMGLAVLCGGVCLAGHWGGTLTHGKGFLLGGDSTAPPHAAAPYAGTAPGAIRYAGQIQPLLQRYCVSCHGPNKSRGHLRLDSFDAALKGGESGAGLVPEDSAHSPIFKLMGLPPDAEEHMPPAGREQPSAQERELVRQWIDSGAGR